MSERKKDSGNRFGGKKADFKKPLKRDAGSRPAPKGRGFESKSVKERKDSGFDLFDKDELAPPRFLAKPGSGSRGPSRGPGGSRKPAFGSDDKRSGGKDYGKGPSSYGKDGARKKTSDSGKFGDRDSKFGSKDRPGTGSRDNKFKSTDRDSKFGSKDRPSTGSRDNKFKSTDRDSKFGSKDRPSSGSRDSKFSKGKPEFRDKKGKDGDVADVKKPFRPKYDPEVKVRKSFRERKTELLGPEVKNDDIRLNKFLANSGICSRREADDIIAQGLVTVNGNTITEMGYRVKKEDVVKYDGRKIIPEPYVYILMNKPKDFITTTEDDKGRKTVMDLLADKIPQRVFPIGRLDRNTTGVLLLTNDGDVAQVMTHPSFDIKKVYHVVLDKKVSGNDLDKLVEGVELEDGVVHADAVSFVESEDKRHVGVEIHSGKNRVVRRMFESLGYDVEKLDRVSMGIFTKKDLPRGKWRHLSQSEVGFLMKLKAKLN